ncbi:MAG: hypothetical protein JWO86_2979 [Myxococcaceae bacterium]|nr:hypothetical protein [Myxococcaceae bacterium]
MNATASLLALPLGVQALAMLVDELHYHRRRGLGAWERIGHPLDTMTVLACMAWVLLVPPSGRAVAAYVVLALVSCIFITKDEAVHAARCSAGEHWLHAVLFVVHPICLASIGVAWPAIHLDDRDLPLWLHGLPAARMVGTQLALTCAFCMYQILYWNLPWTRIRRPSPTR